MSRETLAERRERLDLERARNSRILAGEGVGQMPSTVAAALLGVVADEWRVEAIELESSTRRGATGRRKLLREAADLAVDLAASLRDVGADVDSEVAPEPQCGAAPTFGPFEHAGQPLICSKPASQQHDVHRDDRAGIEWPDAGQSAAYLRGETDTPPQPVQDTPKEGSPVAPMFVDPPARPTFAALALPPDPSTAPEHRSVSQISEYADCGLRYRLERRDGHVPRPAWWNVGGKALHACVEHVEHTAGSAPDWSTVFHREISREVVESGVPMDRWRAAAKGSEGYTWWLVEGEGMLARYLQARQGWIGEGWQIMRIGAEMVPVVEWRFTLNVAGPGQAMVPLVGVVDQAWTRGEEIRIRDVKAGKSRPDDTFQLKVYARALRSVADDQARAAQLQIAGDYYLARRGEVTTPVDLGAHVDHEVTYRTITMDTAERAGLYLPRVSSFCSGCGVAEYCPTRS